MTTHQLMLGFGLFFWSLLGLTPIYFGLRIRQNKVRHFPIVGYQPEKAADLTGLNKWVGNCLLLLGSTILLGGILAGTVSIIFLLASLAISSFLSHKLQQGALRYY